MSAPRTLKIVLSAWGSTGDMMPMVAIGAALRRRGHEVTVVANPYFGPAVSEAGLTLVPIGTVAGHEGLMADSTVFGRDQATWEEIYGRHYYPYIADHYRGVEAVVRDRGVDVIVGDEVGAICVAELRGIPRASVTPSVVRFGSHDDPAHPESILSPWTRWMAGGPRRMAALYRLNHLRRGLLRWPRRNRVLAEGHPIAAFRRSVGLASNAGVFSGPVVGLWPDWFAPPQRDWPPGAVATGFPLYPPPTFADQPPGQDASRLPVVATTGSVAGSQPDFYQAVVAACRATGRPGLLVTPHDDHIPRDLPSNVTHVRHVPFGEILGRTGLLIHHGGIGTAAYALAAGVPQIVVPMRGDQFDNGNRLVRLGVAAMVAVEPGRPDRFVRTVQKMLTSSRVAECCRRCKARLDPGAGLRGAAELIEGLAR